MYSANAKYYIKHRTGRTSFYKKIPFSGDDKKIIHQEALDKKREFQKILGVDVIFNISYTKKEIKEIKEDPDPITVEYMEDIGEREKIRSGVIKSHELKAKESIDLLDKYDINIFNEGGYIEDEERTTVLNKYEQKNNNVI